MFPNEISLDKSLLILKPNFETGIINVNLETVFLRIVRWIQSQSEISKLALASPS